MNSEWTIREPLKEGDSHEEKSYYPEESKFNFTCKKCSNTATLYFAFEYTYGTWYLIKCNNCNEEEVLYGTDG